ncbi:MarR family winged helix-turn-helix transcriptional regulator [Paenibacillus sepulcri]|uniref:MarR family transcriptional regulator n=1 Tax=Paenibacillus sepulcri TaxID=359917 RepID=A0ABS7C7K9_9BACL|nr:MarR family transcriptional regulator [Paenibacillus sepulcri]
MVLPDNVVKLIHDVNLEIAFRIKKDLAPYGITPEQALILILLQERDKLSQNEIAGRLNKDKSSITRMIISLEQKRIIRRMVRENDRRYFIVSLTETGLRLAEDIFPIVDHIPGLAVKGIADHEMQELRRLLAKIRENVH